MVRAYITNPAAFDRAGKVKGPIHFASPVSPAPVHQPLSVSLVLRPITRTETEQLFSELHYRRYGEYTQ